MELVHGSHIIALTCTFRTLAAPPSPPETIAVTTSSNNYTVSWSPPLTSDLRVGGVVGYVVSVTGEGCGCVSVNVSTNTTSVVCSGWKVKGQTCVFEVRTLTQCGLVSDRVVESVTLAVPLTPTQLSVKPDYRELQFVDIEFTGVNTTSYNNLSYLIKAYGNVFSLRSKDCNNVTKHCILRIYTSQIPAKLDLLDLDQWPISVQACRVFGCGSPVITQIRANIVTDISVTPLTRSVSLSCNLFSSSQESIIIVFMIIFVTVGKVIQMLRKVSNNKLQKVGSELVSNPSHNSVTSETSVTEHTSVFIEEESVNSDLTEVHMEQKKECKDIVPGSSEEVIFSVVHTSYEGSK